MGLYSTKGFQVKKRLKTAKVAIQRSEKMKWCVYNQN